MRQRLNAPMLRLCHPAEWPQSWSGFLWFAAHSIPSDREPLSCHRQIEGDPKFQPGATLRSWVQISTMQTTSRLKQHQTVCKALHFLDRKRQQMWNVNHNLYIYPHISTIIHSPTILRPGKLLFGSYNFSAHATDPSANRAAKACPVDSICSTRPAAATLGPASPPNLGSPQQRAWPLLNLARHGTRTMKTGWKPHEMRENWRWNRWNQQNLATIVSHLARRRNLMAKAFRVAQIFGACTMAVKVSPSVSPVSRRVEQTSKICPWDDKSPGKRMEERQNMPCWCNMMQLWLWDLSDLRWHGAFKLNKPDIEFI